MRRRYSRYDIARALKLYAVTDSAWLGTRSLSSCVAEAVAGGATFVQLRDKGASTDQLVAEAERLMPLCRAARVPFVVDDDVEAALACGADGVHVGQEDLSCARAREMLGPDAIVGVSASTVEQALAAEAAGADYVGVGAIFSTPTKPDAGAVGVETLRAICRAVSIPVVAIGGLDANTVGSLANTGACGAAVVSALFAADDIERAAGELLAKVDLAVGSSALSFREPVRMSLPSVLSIAGSDSSGGAGIQADIKTIMANGLFAQTAITALTAQNTTGVYGVVDIDPSFVVRQIDVVFDDIVPAAVKIGMVSCAQIVDAIAEALVRRGARNIVLDPVMVATSGSKLISDEAARRLVDVLFPLADIITPNLPEAEALCGMPLDSREAVEEAARALSQLTPGAVLVKGGHFAEEGSCRMANDYVLANGEGTWISGPYVDVDNSHGTGCSLSSAIACGLAVGRPVVDAVRAAKSYVARGLAAGLDLGRGSGPFDHAWQFAATVRRPV